MREQLIRYLLGELDADERSDLQSRLKSSPELRAELEQLRSCIAASQDDDLFAPDAPRGLAARTAGRVVSGEGARDSFRARHDGKLSHAGDGPAGILGWSLADLTVAGGVMLAVSMLIFPALRNSRDGTRQTVCQRNLQQLGVYVGLYAQNHGGYIPEVGPNEHAGVFVLRLLASGHVLPEDMKTSLVCPGAPLADKVRAGTFEIVLPNAAQIRAMSPHELANVSAKASPFYAYALPYRVNGKYYKIRDDRRRMSPVISDTSGDDQANSMSPNHGRRLVQVQWADGSLRALPSIVLPGLDDDMYHNFRGKVKAGLGPLDTVLGPSEATPGEDELVDGK